MNKKIKIFVIVGIILFFVIIIKEGYCQSYPYDRSAAIAYADSYWSWPNYNRSKYWIEVDPETGEHASDCANFATQCLTAGGRDPYDPFYDNLPLHISGYQPSYYSCTKNLAPYLRKISIETVGDPSIVEPGDIILLKYDATETDFYHAVIIVEVEGQNIYYTAHTNDRQHCLLQDPQNQRYHYFHILDGYLFWSDWGWGYWRQIMGSWIGPNQFENVSAAGVNPQNGSELRGYNQFFISGMPSNANIVHAHLRMSVNSHSGYPPLELNINHIINMGIPSAAECAAPPYYLQGKEVNASTDDIIWFDLSNTNAPTHIMEANNGNCMFGIGFSDNNINTRSYYFFYARNWGSDVDAKLKVFVDENNEQLSLELLHNPEIDQSIINPSLFIKGNLIKEGVEIEFSSGNDEDAQLRIYDVGGRLIRTWVFSGFNNTTRVYWNCRDNFGQLCPQGIYFAKLYTPSEVLMEKIEIIE